MVRSLLYVSLVLVSGCSSFAPAELQRPMTIAEYAHVRHDTPYVIRACARGAWLTYVGVRHSRVPDSEPISTVVREIEAAAPTAVLVEGQVPAVSPSFDDAVSTWGEPGAAAFLARERGLPVTSLDRPIADEARALRERFGDELAIVFYGLRIVAQEKSKQDDALFVQDFVTQKLLPWMYRNGISSERLTFDQFVELSRAVTGVNNPLSAAERSWFDPLASVDRFGFRTIARHLVDTRDVAMASRLLGAVRPGQRVVAVAGHSHVVMQEPTLRSALGCPPAVETTPGRRTSPPLLRCDQTCDAVLGS